MWLYLRTNLDPFFYFLHILLILLNQPLFSFFLNLESGCYYNYHHYGEGDRIITNEPCLNCTCHNRMLMCYLRVCPFTKPIGQDCIVEKREDQCCPVITCPEGERARDIFNKIIWFLIQSIYLFYSASWAYRWKHTITVNRLGNSRQLWMLNRR